MRAGQFFGKEDIRVVDVPEPKPKPGEAIVDVEWCGICGSDLHEYLMGPVTVPRKERPHPVTGEHLPLTFGHEFCGRISQIPEGSKLKVGQAVMADPRFRCQSCDNCHNRYSNGCATWGFRGLSGGGGGLAEKCAVAEDQLYVIPDSTLEYAAVLEPLTVVWHAVRGTGIKDFANQTVLIVGGGPIGIALVYVLRVWNAKEIFLSEPTSTRRKQNEKIVDVVINPITEKVGDRCRELTNGKGVDIAFDCAGVPPGIEAAFDALRFHGTYMNVAGWEKPMVVPRWWYMLKEITMKASMSYTDDDFRETVDAFVAGKFKGVQTMITDRVQLEDVAAKGFEALVKNKDDHIKILVTPKKL